MAAPLAPRALQAPIILARAATLRVYPARRCVSAPIFVNSLCAQPALPLPHSQLSSTILRHVKGKSSSVGASACCALGSYFSSGFCYSCLPGRFSDTQGATAFSDCRFCAQVCNASIASAGPAPPISQLTNYPHFCARALSALAARHPALAARRCVSARGGAQPSCPLPQIPLHFHLCHRERTTLNQRSSLEVIQTSVDPALLCVAILRGTLISLALECPPCPNPPLLHPSSFFFFFINAGDVQSRNGQLIVCCVPNLPIRTVQPQHRSARMHSMPAGQVQPHPWPDLLQRLHLLPGRLLHQRHCRHGLEPVRNVRGWHVRPLFGQPLRALSLV